MTVIRGFGLIAVAALVASCGKKMPEQGKALMDTGWFVDTALFDPTTCPHRWVATDPEDGVRTWYWRDPITVHTQTDKHHQYELVWVNGNTELVPHELVWESEGLKGVLVPDAPLAANTDYTLQLTDCSTYQEIDFRTSTLGLPLDDHPSELIGRTYLLDVDNATWVEPGGVESLMAIYFNVPILVAVTYADEQRIDLLGAPGMADILGNIVQDKTQATWDFPTAAFDEKPWFFTEAEYIVLESEEVLIPVFQMSLEATISADMNFLGGGELRGLGDTRYVGALLNEPNNPNALCELAAGLGVTCVPCPDNEPYCLNLHATEISGTLLPDVALVPRN